MAVISFSKDPKNVWCVAGWAFRQILDDVIAQFPADSELLAKLEQSREIKGLIVERLSPEFAVRVTNSIKDVAEGILKGTIRSGIHDKPYGDQETVRQYFEALRELLEAIPSQEHRL